MEKHIFRNELYYRINKFQPGRPTLVFLHGMSGSSSAWTRYEQYFGDRYNILNLDLRGHGKSFKPLRYEDYAISMFARDVFDLMTHLDISRPIFVAHSFATLIAQELIARHQDVAGSLIFLAPSCNVARRLAARIIKPFLYLSQAMRLWPVDHPRGGHVDYSVFGFTGDWDLRRMIPDIRNTGVRLYLWLSLMAYSVNFEDFVSKITMPTLLLHGDKDTVFPVENSVRMSHKIKGSTCSIIQGANHQLVLNNFSEVAAAMDHFLDKR